MRGTSASVDDAGGRADADPDDRIRAAARGGRISEIDLDPRALRLTPVELGQRVRQAVNAALAGQRAELNRVLAGLSDRAALVRAAAPHDQELMATHRLHAELTRALADSGLGGLAAGVDSRGIDRLTDETADIAKQLLRAGGAAPVAGTGEYSDGAVHVLVSGTRVATVGVTYQALSMQSRDLAARLLQAVNTALDDARPDASDAEVVDHRLAARLAALTDESERQMRSFSAEMATVLVRIRRRRSELGVNRG